LGWKKNDVARKAQEEDGKTGHTCPFAVLFSFKLNKEGTGGGKLSKLTLLLGKIQAGKPPPPLPYMRPRQLKAGQYAKGS